MNEHDILQSFRHNGNGTWTPRKEIAVAGVRMEPGVVFSRGEPLGGIDVAAYLDDLAERYPLSVRT
jgi:hypothetical protein